MKKYTNILLILLFIILEVFLLTKSSIIVHSFNKTMYIIMYTLMPTMFFSILFSQILIKLHFEKYIPRKIIKKLFNISDQESIIFILSMISGFPNNAKMLKNNKNLNNIINYTSFINPIYLIGTVGSIYLKNIKLAIIILLSHYISNIIIGILLRNKNIKEDKKNNIKEDNFINIYYTSLKSTINTLVIIFSNILFFTIINELIIYIFKINPILIGFIEFSKGIYNISILNINNYIKGLLILIILSFNSLSVHMQMISINNNIKYIKYILYRIINILISIIIYTIIYHI